MIMSQPHPHGSTVSAGPQNSLNIYVPKCQKETLFYILSSWIFSKQLSSQQKTNQNKNDHVYVTTISQVEDNGHLPNNCFRALWVVSMFCILIIQCTYKCNPLYIILIHYLTSNTYIQKNFLFFRINNM